MPVQDVLFNISVVLFVLAGLCFIAVVVMFFAFNIRDIRADLSGKKRIEAIARMDGDTRPARGRRRGPAKEDEAPQTVVAPAQAPTHSEQLRQDRMEQDEEDARRRRTSREVAASAPKSASSWLRPGEDGVDVQEAPRVESDSSPTTVIADNVEATTVISPLPELVEEPSQSTFPSAIPAAGQTASAGFKVVRKIVLMESTEFVQVG